MLGRESLQRLQSQPQTAHRVASGNNVKRKKGGGKGTYVAIHTTQFMGNKLPPCKGFLHLWFYILYESQREAATQHTLTFPSSEVHSSHVHWLLDESILILAGLIYLDLLQKHGDPLLAPSKPTLKRTHLKHNK